MKTLLLSFVLISCSFAQNLSPAQKEADFRHLASLFSVYYAPIEWKKQLFNFDALNIKPWLDRVARTTTDLDFYEICVEYVASLNDTHDRFSLPSDFSASVGFTADIYDGILLVDSINRNALPASSYPFAIGDELVSVDDVEVQQLIKDLSKYAAYGNAIAQKRIAAARITSRPQSVMPHAADLIGKSARVVLRLQDGELQTYTMPWIATGTPLEVGRVPSPRQLGKRSVSAGEGEPEYMNELRQAQWSGVLNAAEEGLNGYGSRSPIFVNALTNAGFTRRLGGAASDFFYSGTFRFEELTIGYIRIPSYSPPSAGTALAQFDQEIAFMNANTDGLIVDEMRNPGGLLCFGEDIAVRLIPYQFQATGFQLRPFWTRINSFYNSWISARVAGAPQQIIDQYEVLFKAMLTANQQGRTVTESLPLCSSSLTRAGAPNAYRKPLMMLIDEFSTSTADSVPAMIKDAGRAVLYGMRTNGAGGNNTSLAAGAYSEGDTGMTLALQTRPNKVGGFGYPYTDYLENVGVWPDLPDDYMTKANLTGNGAPFVSGFLQHMAAEIRARR